SDNRLWFTISLLNMLADRIRLTKILAGKYLVDYRDRFGPLIILVGEITSAFERYPHGRQIVRLHAVSQRHVHLVLSFGFCFLVRKEEHDVVLCHEGKSAARECNSTNARHRFNLVMKLDQPDASYVRVATLH